MRKILLILFLGGVGIFLTRSVAQVVPEGKFITFNGLDQYLSISNHKDFNIKVGESFTLSFRMNPIDFDSTYSIISKGNSMAPESRYEFFTYKTSTNPNIGLHVHNTHDVDLSSPYIACLEAGKWVHIAWVYNATEKCSRIYINGSLISSVFNTVIGKQAIENIYSLMVGCSWTDSNNPVQYQFWHGELDELRIWKRALTANNLVTDLSSPKAATDNLVAAYDFEKVDFSTVPDVSGKGHNGQLFGYGIRVLKTLLPTAIGNENERLVGFRLIPDFSWQSVRSVTVDFTGTNDLSDIAAVKVYACGSSERFNPNTAKLFGIATRIGAKTIIYGNMKLAEGSNYFWVTASISCTAHEGNQIISSLVSYTGGDGMKHDIPELKGTRTILLSHKLLFSGGDGGSKNYRIPSIVAAQNGALITATDKRWDNPSDLPNHIDVVVRRSTNRGRTWSDPVTIAGAETNSGFGDPALVLNRKNAEIICLFAGGNGFFASTPTNPIRIYQSKSTDHGSTWSVPTDITPQIYGFESPNTITAGWQGAFVTSGSMTQLKSGRLMAALVVREKVDRTVSNFIIYSDDFGQSWKVSPNRAAENGNESKLVELENGKILMSIRSTEIRRFSISNDQGMTWCQSFPQADIVDPCCNGDMIRYTAKSDGFNKNRLLHSIPFAGTRSNISVLISYDEGKTWPVRKTIFKEASAYSALCALNDGTIGMYFESGEYETYEMYFVRCSLKWLSNGTDTWTRRTSGVVDSAEDIAQNNPDITIYPNPAEDFVNVAGTFPLNTPVEIYNVQGKLMSRVLVQNPGTPLRISVQQFPSGIYFLKIGEKSERIVVK
ncbi:MAG: exo-alpha-sialidase [Bacteroidales bacterium]|nr:exo-alpha-sialidase [Bacteroidales bacterium]